ncbi:hypothetical protein D917_10523 [Trichinella nativa]|uniref:Uncharacterized protein n=1 Tax=Trichinella nativa TaxID=6335 RepID=A0A1Y3EAE9_9BILA|nr:hypothetical protein D917_10523 [Trichinella nativa]
MSTVEGTKFLQIKLIVEPNSKKIIALYPLTKPYLKLGPFNSVAHDGGPLRLDPSCLNAFRNGNFVPGDRFFRRSNSVAATVAVLDVRQQHHAFGYG